MAFRKIFSRLSFWSACLGNLFEHYDSALFGFLSPFLAPLLFPKKEPITALILTYAMIPLGMLARPFGSLVFGYIGDVYGRKQALFLSLVGMAFVSGGIALSPTYAQVGVFAPVIFCLARVLQNFLASGETMGGAIFLLENSPEKERDLLSSLYNSSTLGGILLASAGVSLLSYSQIIDPGWRGLYLFGCITALFGCIVRRQVDAQTTTQPSRKFSEMVSNWGKTFWNFRKSLFLIALSSGFAYANYAMALVFMNGFIPLISPLTKTQMIGLNTSLLLLEFCTLPFFGWMASKMSREKLMLTASIGLALSATPLFMLLKDASLGTVIGVRICFVILGAAFFAPFHAWIQQLIPAAHRYATVSFGYALGSQALGGTSAAISLWCFKKNGIVASASWYWVGLAVINSAIFAWSLWTKQTKVSPTRIE